MKVQELIDALSNFRCDAQVCFWEHDESAGIEIVHTIESVSRDNLGNVGINWFEDAKHFPGISLDIDNK